MSQPDIITSTMTWNWKCVEKWWTENDPDGAETVENPANLPWMFLFFWAVNHSISERSEWLDLDQDHDPIAQESLSVRNT